MPNERDHPAGGPSISADHAQLSDLVSRIRSAIESGRVSLTKDLLLRLAGLYKSHFRREELIMARIEYPAFQDHRREHRNLIDTLAAINQTLQLENLHGVSRDVAAHLETTLRHTIETDQQFLEFMMDAMQLKFAK